MYSLPDRIAFLASDDAAVYRRRNNRSKRRPVDAVTDVSNPTDKSVTVVLCFFHRPARDRPNNGQALCLGVEQIDGNQGMKHSFNILFIAILCTVIITLGQTSDIVRGQNALHAERQDESPLSPLLAASEAGDVDKVTTLLEDGAPIEETNKEGRTALMLAIVRNRRDVVQLLIKVGANVNREAPDKWTPLCFALSCASKDIVKDLLDAKANLHVRYGRGRTPLMVVAANGSNDKLELLLSLGVDSKDIDDDGWNALFYAAEANGNEETIMSLLYSGIDVNARDLEHKTALYYAKEKKRDNIIELLMLSGATE